MTPLQRALKKLSLQQRAVYEIICKAKFIRASGPQLTTCKSMVRTGLIKINAESEHKNEFVLDGDPVTLPVKYSHPLELVGVKAPPLPSKRKIEIEEQEPEPKHTPMATPVKPLVRTAAIYDNPSREKYVERWISEDIKPDPKTFVPVKCLQDWQMKYIMHNYEGNTAQEMADKIKADVMAVKLFCQANAITPLPFKQGKRKQQAA